MQIVCFIDPYETTYREVEHLLQEYRVMRLGVLECGMVDKDTSPKVAKVLTRVYRLDKNIFGDYCYYFLKNEWR